MKNTNSVCVELNERGREQLQRPHRDRAREGPAGIVRTVPFTLGQMEGSGQRTDMVELSCFHDSFIEL